MFDLKFTSNWNNKLDCHAFTTIRMYNPSKHFVGNGVNILLKEESKGTGVIMEVRRFLLADLNPYVAYLDTGYSVPECQEILRKMHSKIDTRTYKFALLLIVKDKPATGSGK